MSKNKVFANKENLSQFGYKISIYSQIDYTNVIYLANSIINKSFEIPKATVKHF
jgi:hypothetical protein